MRGVAWPPDTSVMLRERWPGHGDADAMDEDGDDQAAPVSLNRSVGLALPSQLGLDASRVQLLNSVLFQREYVDTDGIRRVAALARHAPTTPSYWTADDGPRSRPLVSGLHMTTGDAPPALRGVRSSLGGSGALEGADISTRRVFEDAEPHETERHFQGRTAEQRYAWRAGWGPGERLATPLRRGRIVHGPVGAVGSADATTALLQLHRHHGGGPGGHGVAGAHAEAAANALVRDAAASAPHGSVRKHTWALVAALWGHLDEQRDPNAHREHRKRRLALAQWVRDAVADEVAQELLACVSPLQRCAVLLSAGRATEAVALCAGEANSPRLAALLAACVGTRESKRAALAQLQQWETDGCVELLDPSAVRCVQLVTGGTSEAFESLDWRRRFGVLLWYRFATDLPVSASIRALENFFGSDSQATRARRINGTEMQYQLLRLYAHPGLDAGSVLVPENWGSAPLEWVECWVLRWVLARLAQRNGQAEARVIVSLAGARPVGAALTHRVGGQLEAQGVWEWALYTWLACGDTAPDTARHACEAILQRWAPAVLPLLARDWTAAHPWLVDATRAARHYRVAAEGLHRLDWEDTLAAAELVRDLPAPGPLGRLVALAVLRPSADRSAQLQAYALACSPSWWGRAVLVCAAAVSSSPAGPASAQLQAAAQQPAWASAVARAAREATSDEQRYALAVVASRMAVVDASAARDLSVTPQYARDQLWDAAEAYLAPRTK